MWHYILFLSEDCTARWFCIFSGHFLQPCLLWHYFFPPFFCLLLHFLCPPVKNRVSQDTCSLSGHAALGFLMHSEDFNGSPDTDDSQISISCSTLIQIQIHLLSTKYVSGSVGVPLLSRQRGTLSKWSLILIALTELRCWPLCLSLCPPSPDTCPYSIILTLGLLA